MSSDLVTRAESLLNEHLTNGELSYTYKLLSRELAIHVNDAKKILYGFSKKHKDLIDVNYVIVGYVDKGGNLEKSVKLTSDLEEKTKFTKIESVQVYSITMKNMKIQEVLSDINSKLHSFDINKENLQTWGVIKGMDVVQTESVIKRNEGSPAPVRSNLSTRPSSITTKKEEKPKTEKKKELDMGLLSDRIRQRNAAAATNTTSNDKKKPAQPTFGRSFTSNAASKPKAQPKPRAKTDSAVEVIEDVELNDAEYSKKIEEERKEKERKKKELESMFDDDDDDFSEIKDDTEDIKEVEVEEIQEVEEPVKPVEQKKTLNDLEDMFDDSFSQSQSQKTQSQPQERLQSKEESNENEKEEAKEEASASYYDEDGYLVTTVKKAGPKPKAKRAISPMASRTDTVKESPPAKKAKTKTGPKQQSSLLNFFGKPKK